MVVASSWPPCVERLPQHRCKPVGRKMGGNCNFLLVNLDKTLIIGKFINCLCPKTSDGRMHLSNNAVKLAIFSELNTTVVRESAQELIGKIGRD